MPPELKSHFELFPWGVGKEIQLKFNCCPQIKLGKVNKLEVDQINRSVLQINACNQAECFQYIFLRLVGDLI